MRILSDINSTEVDGSGLHNVSRNAIEYGIGVGLASVYWYRELLVHWFYRRAD